ncbi:MAG: hypothetical protein Q4G08_07350 [Capnocytophaga sp.]|nr:hypothetical protein [Capnocytophaga sp.]
MSMERELARGLKMLGRRTAETTAVTVVSVDKKNGTCRVDDDGMQYEVRLTSVVEESRRRYYVFPKIGSDILIAPIGEDNHRCHVIAVSEVESVELCIETTEFQIDKDGFLIKKKDETLGKLIGDLIAEIRKMKFTTNTGSTIMLVNEPQFIQLEKRFKNLLKNS